MKQKRVFFQNEPGWMAESFIIAILVFGAQAFGILFLMVDCFRGFPIAKEDIGLFISLPIIFMVVPFIMYPEIISRFSWNIHLDDEKVWMKGDRIAAKWYRVQLPVEISYCDIVSMSIEYSSKNSSGQSIRTWFYGPLWSKKRYLTLITDGGKRKRLHVSHYTDAMLAEIIDEIASRCEEKDNKYDGRRAAQILFKL